MDRYEGKFLTIRSAARTGILSEKLLRKLHREGKLPGVAAGNRFYINIPLLLEKLDALSLEGGTVGEG